MWCFVSSARASFTATQRWRKTSSSLAWTDLNRNDIAEGTRGCTYLTAGCEINFTQLTSNFGTAALNRYGNFPRTWNLESAVELQHELIPRLSVSGAWFHGAFHNLTSTYHTEWTYADYTPIQIFNPREPGVKGQRPLVDQVEQRRQVVDQDVAHRLAALGGQLGDGDPVGALGLPAVQLQGRP